LRGPVRLRQDASLAEILGAIERRPHLISIG